MSKNDKIDINNETQEQQYFRHFYYLFNFCQFFTLCISFIVRPVLSPRRVLGVTQNSKYQPNISLVCASTAGRLPKTTEVIGTKNHCKYIITERQGLYLAGLGGSNIKLIQTLKIKKNVAMVISVLVTKGKLQPITLCLKASPPKNRGSQPKDDINMLAVAQLKFPSTYW